MVLGIPASYPERFGNLPDAFSAHARNPRSLCKVRSFVCDEVHNPLLIDDPGMAMRLLMAGMA